MDTQQLSGNNQNSLNDLNNSNSNPKNTENSENDKDLSINENIKIAINVIDYKCNIEYIAENEENIKNYKSNDVLQNINDNEFDKKNIDFEDLKEKLNKVYEDEKLTVALLEIMVF